MYLYLSNTICKKIKRKTFYVCIDQEKKLPHRYAFINFEIYSYYVRCSFPHRNVKILKKMYGQTCQFTMVNLREATVGIKSKPASEHVRKFSRAQLLKFPKIIIKLYVLEDHIPVTFFSLFQVALMH